MSDINNFCKSLNDFVGNNKNKLLLHNIAKDRYSPNMFLFLGQYGIGKRTLAKLFALECNSNHCNNDLYLLYDYTDFTDSHLYDSIANVDNSNITRFIIINDFTEERSCGHYLYQVVKPNITKGWGKMTSCIFRYKVLRRMQYGWWVCRTKSIR